MSAVKLVSESDAVEMLSLAFSAHGEQRQKRLVAALCAISLVVGIDAFTLAMTDAADALFLDSAPTNAH